MRKIGKMQKLEVEYKNRLKAGGIVRQLRARTATDERPETMNNQVKKMCKNY